MDKQKDLEIMLEYARHDCKLMADLLYAYVVGRRSLDDNMGDAYNAMNRWRDKKNDKSIGV